MAATMLKCTSAVLRRSLLLCTFLAVMPATVAAVPRYTLTSLGPLQATALNNQGQVAGSVWVGDNEEHAFLWQNGSLTDLGTLAPGLGSTALGINDLSQVVGYSGHSMYIDDWGSYRVRWHAFVWDQDTGMQDLGSLSGGDTWAFDINNTGWVLGQDYGSYQDDSRVFTWDIDDGTSVIDVPGAFYGRWMRLNDARQAVGNTTGAAGSFPRAVIWDAVAGTRYLDDTGAHFMSAAGINNLGQVVGWVADSPTDVLPFAWYEASGTRALVSPTSLSASAADINNLSEIVGWAEMGELAGIHAFLWSGDQVIDLNDLIPGGVVLSRAIAVNDRSQIVAASDGTDGTTYYLLDPIPEPSSLAVLVLGLVGTRVETIRRRRCPRAL